MPGHRLRIGPRAGGAAPRRGVWSVSSATLLARGPWHHNDGAHLGIGVHLVSVAEGFRAVGRQVEELHRLSAPGSLLTRGSGPWCGGTSGRAPERSGRSVSDRHVP